MRELKVAVVGPLSGPRAAYGQLIEATVAAFDRPAGLHLQLFDDRAQTDAALQAARAICEADCDVVVGHFNSDCAREVRPVYRAADIPLLLPASTAVGLPDGRHVFRLCADDWQQATAIAALVRARFAQFRLHYWSDGSAYAKRLHKLLEQALGYALIPFAGHIGSSQAAQNAVVYLGSHVSIMKQMADEGDDGQGWVSICCDDCWIDEFRDSARSQTYVCAPHASYGKLLEDALSIVRSVYLEQCAQMTQFFDASGESRSAGFHMYEVCAGRSFRCE